MQKQYSMLTMKESGLGQLTSILYDHLKLMKQRDAKVNEIITSSAKHSQTSLFDAKFKALQQEKNLLLGIMDDITEMTQFLTKIILIENLYNSHYNPLKLSQEAARGKYARNINKYENKQKHLSEVSSFVELIFMGNTHLSSLQTVIDNVIVECENQNIEIINRNHCGAVMKKMPRAFYKAFYVYHHSAQGYKLMSDILRCSLVFNDFPSIYRTFTIIENILKSSGGILNVKDRFQPRTIEFGYRDILINFYIPNAKIMCEMQLHHKLFYQYKKISHTMYKYARLFQRDSSNLAYKYAIKFIQPKVGTQKNYEPTAQEMDYGASGMEQKQSETVVVTKSCEELIKDWGLERFWPKFVENGYDYQIDDFQELLQDKDVLNILKDDIGLKTGHSKRFIRNATKFFEDLEQSKQKKTVVPNIAKKSMPIPLPSSITNESKDEEGKTKDVRMDCVRGRKELITYESVAQLFKSPDLVAKFKKSGINMTKQDYAILTRIDRRLFVNIDVYDVVNSSDKPHKIGYGVNLSAPHMHIRSLKKFEFLFTRNNNKPINFLDVGCGTGYFTTLIAVGMIIYKCPFGSQVRGMEFHPNLVSQGRFAAISMGIENIIHFHKCDTDFDNIGLKDFAPFDGIMVGAGIEEQDKERLKLQLAVGGLLLVVVEDEKTKKQTMREIWRVSEDKFKENIYLGVRYRKLRGRLEFL